MFNFTSATPFVGSLWNHFLQSSQQSRSEDFAREMFGRQRDANTQMAQMMIGAQRWNMKNQASLNRSGLVSAGLNPNNPNGLFTTGGISPSTPSTSPTSATYNAPDTSGFSEFGKLIQNEPLVKAQARALNANAEEQEIKNAGLREKQNVVSALSPLVVATLDPQGDQVNFQLNTPEGLDTYKDIKKLASDFAQWRASEAYGKLMEFVHSGQYSNKKVRDALVNEKYEDVRNLIALTQKFIQEKKLFKAQEETEKERKTLVHNQGQTELERKKLVVSETELNNLIKTLQAHGQAGILSRLFGDDTSLPGSGAALLELILSSVASNSGSLAGAAVKAATVK